MLFKTAQTHFGNEVISALLLLPLRHATLAQAKTDVFFNGEPREERVALKHHATIGAWAINGLAIEHHDASTGLVESSHDAQQSRFATP